MKPFLSGAVGATLIVLAFTARYWWAGHHQRLAVDKLRLGKTSAPYNSPAPTDGPSQNGSNLSPPFSPAAAKEKTAPVGDVVVNVKADGNVVVNRLTLSAAELGYLLKSLVALNSKQTVLIRGDEAGAYKNIVGVLNICIEAGIKPAEMKVDQADATSVMNEIKRSTAPDDKNKIYETDTARERLEKIYRASKALSTREKYQLLNNSSVSGRPQPALSGTELATPTPRASP
jgi:hypothetical protein